MSSALPKPVTATVKVFFFAAFTTSAQVFQGPLASTQ